MGERKLLLFHHSGCAKFFFDQGVKDGFILPDPGWQLLLDDLPYTIFPLHSQHDPVAAIITYINSEQAFLQSIGLAKIKFSQSAFGLDKLGKLNIPDKLYLHKDAFEFS